MNKDQILEDIKNHLQGINDEILGYGYSLNLTTKNKNNEYVNDYITISKNYHNNSIYSTIYTNTVI